MIATVHDTGPIVAALNAGDRRHRDYARLLAGLTGRLLPSPVKPAHVPVLTLLR